MQREWPWARGFAAEEKGDARSHLTCGGRRSPHGFPAGKASLHVQQREGPGSCRVTKCITGIECNRRQKSLLVEIVQLGSGGKRRQLKPAYRHQSTTQTYAWRSPPEIPRALGMRIPRDSLGSVVLPFPSASRQHRHSSRCLVSGVGLFHSLDGTAACAGTETGLHRRDTGTGTGPQKTPGQGRDCSAGTPFLSLRHCSCHSPRSQDLLSWQ